MASCTPSSSISWIRTLLDFASANSQDKHGEQLKFMYCSCKNTWNDSTVCCPLIGQRKTKVFCHQAKVWNWSGETLSPGALLPVLYFSSRHPPPPPFRPFLAPTICPWVSRMTSGVLEMQNFTRAYMRGWTHVRTDDLPETRFLGCIVNQIFLRMLMVLRY